MSDEDRKRIEDKALDYAGSCNVSPFMFHGYIAGATAEHERLQKEIDRVRAKNAKAVALLSEILDPSEIEKLLTLKP